jgi:hypothetical protein
MVARCNVRPLPWVFLDNSPMTGDWRDWRPAIWLTMLGIAVMLLFSPFYFGAIFIGAAIGVSIRIGQRRRRASASESTGPRRRR